ncbi:hypothetical protein EV363DRAFT_391444 [Boletus edulis]|nr:hypothetical protein EV363DRAFT_391444 [Boletus edulis]
MLVFATGYVPLLLLSTQQCRSEVHLVRFEDMEIYATACANSVDPQGAGKVNEVRGLMEAGDVDNIFRDCIRCRVISNWRVSTAAILRSASDCLHDGVYHN